MKSKETELSPSTITKDFLTKRLKLAHRFLDPDEFIHSWEIKDDELSLTIHKKEGK